MRGLLLLCAVGIAYPGQAADASPPQGRADPPERVDEARSDLRRAQAHEQAGDALECVRELAPVVWQLTALEDEALEDAIQKTYDRCSAAAGRNYENIKPRVCRLTIDGAIAATAAPAVLVPKRAKAACLALVPGPPRKDALPGHEGNVCARVALVWSAKGLQRRELTFEGGPLADDVWCCNLDAIATGRLDGHTVVRVSGSGHPCDGGTAVQGSDALYQWNGKSLVSPKDLSVEYH